MILRTIKCAICGCTHTETTPGAGWPGWSGLIGVKLDEDENPQLCPVHTASVMNHIELLKQTNNGVKIV